MLSLKLVRRLALGKSLGELMTEQFRVHDFLLFFISILSRI